MILLKININRILTVKSKCNSPRSIYRDRISFGFGVQSMEMPTRHVHVFWHDRLLQSIQQANAFFLVVRANLGTLSDGKKLFQAFVPPT